jgi:hypothetical protein
MPAATGGGHGNEEAKMDRDANIASAIGALTLLVARIAKAAEDRGGGVGLEAMRTEIEGVLQELAGTPEDLGQIVLRQFLAQTTKDTPSMRSVLVH